MALKGRFLGWVTLSYIYGKTKEGRVPYFGGFGATWDRLVARGQHGREAIAPYLSWDVGT